MYDDKKSRVNRLLNRIKQGEHECVSELHDIMAPTLRYLALKYLKNEDEADDLVQDFWCDIVKYAQKYYFYKNGYGYLCKIMNRQALNRYNKLKRQNEQFDEYVDYSKINGYQTNDIAEVVSLRNDINDAMSQLTETQKIIIQKAYFEGKTVREIASDMGISKTQVSRLKTSATEILKDVLTEKGWDK